MNSKYAELYVHPNDRTPLRLEITRAKGDRVIDGHLVSSTGESFMISASVVDFTWPLELATIDKETRALYDKLAADYEKFANIPFMTYKCEEKDIRNNITDRLNLRPDSKVLEIGCGCGDGSAFIAERLDKRGELFLQELSPAFLAKAISKTSHCEVPIEYAIANGCYLPFPDNYFDAAHHFGGLNTFSEIKRCLSEMARVVKPGGKVVIGDESMGPWLRETQFGKIMMNSNPLLKCQPPIEMLPPIAKDVKLEWIMMDAFYLIEFTVAAAEPEGNYHIPIPSERGGTHWSRYYGNLEGVSDEAKKLAKAACAKTGQSMHDWLDEAVKKAAGDILQ